MKDKVVIITGGAGGIGLSTAEMLLSANARVVIADHDPKAGQLALAKLNANHEGNVSFVQTDVTQVDSVQHLMDKTIAQFGEINVLFNNAGILGGNRFPDSDPQTWKRAINVNVVGVMNSIHAAMPYLKKNEQSTILNMGSTAGLKSSYLDPTYALTKAAVVSLTRSLMFMLEESGVRINCLCPTLVKTDLARNSSSMLSDDELGKFTARRGNRNDRPSLTAQEVAEAAVRLMADTNLNGYCVEMTLDNLWNPIAPILPQKV